MSISDGSYFRATDDSRPTFFRAIHNFIRWLLKLIILDSQNDHHAYLILALHIDADQTAMWAREGDNRGCECVWLYLLCWQGWLLEQCRAPPQYQIVATSSPGSGREWAVSSEQRLSVYQCRGEVSPYRQPLALNRSTSQHIAKYCAIV